MMWSTVAELTGCNGMPATERGCRKYLDNLAAKVPDVRRKRVGTKAFEYHIDFLPANTQEEIKNRYYNSLLSEKTVSTKVVSTRPRSDTATKKNISLIRQCPALLDREVNSLT
ncbi:DNA-binding protein, partial [Klebsiella pneumoniae]